MDATIGSLWMHPETKTSFLLTHILEDSKQVKGLHVEGSELNENIFSFWFLEECFERLEPGDDGYQAALSLFVAASSAKVDSHRGEIDRLTEELGAAQQIQQTVEQFITGDQ